MVDKWEETFLFNLYEKDCINILFIAVLLPPVNVIYYYYKRIVV